MGSHAAVAQEIQQYVLTATQGASAEDPFEVRDLLLTAEAVLVSCLSIVMCDYYGLLFVEQL